MLQHLLLDYHHIVDNTLQHRKILLMMNNRKVLGEHMPRGIHRFIWNLLMGAAFLVMAPAAAWKAWGTSLNGIPVGSYALIGFVVLVLFGFGFREKEKV